MLSAVRTTWAARFAALAILAGLLVQAALGLPVTLRMAAAAAPICGLQHGHDGGSSSAPLAHDHASCLLCQASAAPPLTSATVAIPLPTAVAWIAPQLSAMAGFTLQPLPMGFTSRAPPALA